MMVTRLLVLLFASSAISAAVGIQDASLQFDKRQFQFPKGKGGKVPDPPGAAPRRVVQQSPSKIPGAKRIKIRSGPYNVINMSQKSPSGHAGMLENYPDTNVEKPCEECVLLFQSAGLEYPNGTNANIDTGMWLHHMVHFNTGPTRWDAAGQGKLCIPFLPVRTSISKAERFFTAGNERTPFNYNPGGVDLSSGTGYYLRKEDKFQYLVELMNMNMEDVVVYLTMVYDFIDGPLPKGWMDVKPVWIDVNQCGTSEVRPLKETGSFTIESKPWSPNFEGKIIEAMGHVHDGGIDIDILASSSSAVCKATAKYGESPDYYYRGTSMGGDKVAKSHISSMVGCTNKNIKVSEMKKGQSWSVRGNYDYSKYEGNLERGKQSEIMALSIVLVAIPAEGVPRVNSTFTSFFA